jgi:hypothetical protein
MPASRKEIEHSASKLLVDILNLRPGEVAALYRDNLSDSLVVDSISKEISSLGGIPITIQMSTHPEQYYEYPIPLRSFLKETDLVIEFGRGSIIAYSSTHKEILSAKKARFMSLANIDFDAFVKMIGRIDYEGTLALGEDIVRISDSCEEIKVTSPEGTRIFGRMQGRRGLAVQRNSARRRG